MTEIDLPADRAVVSLSDGLSLHPRGLTGKVRVEPAAAAGSRAIGADALWRNLEQEGLRPGPVVSLPPGGASAARALGATASAEPPRPTIEVEVAPGESCVMLVEDANGALTWVLPDDPPRAAEDVGAARGLASSQRFTLPAATMAAPTGARGLADDVGAKVQAFFFAAIDPLLGPVIHGFAKRWEAGHRPSFTRRFGASDYRIDDPAFERLTEGEWRTLGQGPALLFVHGTFSTSGGFKAIDPAVMSELSRRYGGRTFAFNHPSLTADPRENALSFLGGVPKDVKLEVDIICHSRGGLVARQIEALGRTAGNVRVRRIVFVAATNAGTALADDDHVVDFVNRYTTIARFIPEGTARTVVNALALTVKVLAHGLLRDLEGLAAMNPRGAFLKALNVRGGTTAEYYAIASDFEPKPGTPLISLRRAEDAAADQIFDRTANDLVVPRDGVFADNGAEGFPIGEGRCLKYEPRDGVIHTEFFADQRTGAQLLQWLGAEMAPVTREALGGAAPADVARVFDLVRSRVLLELAAQGGSREAVSRQPDFSPGEYDRLRAHVVNLSGGTFQASGMYTSTKEDVDAIIHEHIPRWAGTLPVGEKLRVVVWAHGGLIGETAGLRIAQKHVDWWKANRVYPIYFVWETGLFDALRAILEQVRGKLPGFGRRDLFDFTTDPLIELGARALGGDKIWGAMKRNAELASAEAGGARYVAQQLAVLAGTPALQQGHSLELHAGGHSAGSIFHSWFLPMARAENVPQFKTLQMLAPAITVAEFDARLAPEIGAGAVDKAVLYTMGRPHEEADNCAGVYRKSLLYLIHHALEREMRTPVLGLEISLRADDAAARLFGLKGAAGAPGRAVWSVTQVSTGRSASAAVHHGDFDDDIPTMSSVAANVLDEPDARVRYSGSPRDARSVDGEWPVSADWLRGVDVSPGFGTVAAQAVASAMAPQATGLSAPIAAAATSAPAAPSAGTRPSGGSAGARRALCIGIDAYEPPNALRGCVNDTQEWRKALGALGFRVDTLLDKQATRQAILDALGGLVRSAKSGEVLVFQYSGHGTQVPDYDGDEREGKDEALVPFDFDDGAFLVDDDLRAVFSQLPDGVNLTCFIDCCHSGTITRMLGRNVDESTADGETRSRYLKETDNWGDWMRAHERFRQRERSIRDIGAGAGAGAGRSREIGADAMRWINFSACDAHEVAYETRGSGDFTKIATAALAAAALQQSNRDFQDAVIRAFGERRRQTPQLDCADGARASRLLQPLA